MKIRKITVFLGVVAFCAVTVVSCKNSLEGKNLFTLCDSLGQTGVWQETLSGLSGMNFDEEENFNYTCPLSYGGACTGLYGPISGMQRARNLVEVSKTKSIDYLIMENSNDIGQYSNLGTLDDLPWFWSYSHFVPDCGLKSLEEASSFWESSFSSIVSSLEKETGAVVRVPFGNDAVSCEVEVVSGTTKDDTLFVHCREFLIPIPVKAGLSPEQLVDYLMTVALRPGCDCIRRSSTKICCIDYIKGYNSFTFDCADTGIVLNVAEGKGLSTFDRFYVGKDTTEWMNPEFWTSAPTVFSQWKGFMDFIMANFPDARKYWLIPTYYMNNPDFDSIKGPYYEAQKRLAEYYGISVLDIAAESGINEGNLLEFYNEGDVHPKDAGYVRWGETLYRLLK